MEEIEDKYTRAEFASLIKEKYPAYKDMDDDELVTSVLDKYPVYKEQVQVYEPPTGTDGAPTNIGVSTNQEDYVDPSTQQDATVQEKPIDYVEVFDPASYDSNVEIFNQAGIPQQGDGEEAVFNSVESLKDYYKKEANRQYPNEKSRELAMGDKYEGFNKWLETGVVQPNTQEVSQAVANITFNRQQDVLDNMPDDKRKEILMRMNLWDKSPEERKTAFKNQADKLEANLEAIDEKYVASLDSLYEQRNNIYNNDEESFEINKQIRMLRRRRDDDLSLGIGELLKLGKKQRALDLFGRSYKNIDKLKNTGERVALSLGQLALDFIDILDYPQNKIIEMYGKHKGLSQEQIEISKKAINTTYAITNQSYALTSAGANLGNTELFKDARKWMQQAAVENENYATYGLERPTDLDDAFGSFDKFFEWAGETVINQSPYLLMAFTGPAAIPLFFASGAGEKSFRVCNR